MYSFAFGIGTKNLKQDWLEVFFPEPLLNPDNQLIKQIASLVDYGGGNKNIDLDDDQIRALIDGIDEPRQQSILSTMKGSSNPCVATFIETDIGLSSTPEAYLKLHLLSYRYVKPNEQNLDNLFAILPNVAWTDIGAVDPAELGELQLKARAEGRIMEVAGVDKFPKMTNYVVPAGIRIAHSARVRLGAYVGEGTTVMHEGLVNYNAGAIGPNMIEGRVSQGVLLDAGTDLGGSASTMGTLSGGGKHIVSIGKDCLIGANAGCGISLGDRCTIEAGLYITAGAVVQVLDEDRNFVRTVKARELSGQNDMLFIRNSQNGVVECRTNKNAISLNESLHAHN
jgi:2,3,4,5-tetrahydropyridine-2-carboxylate N-succinyltransferase|tara:strand:- start:1231 stop:2247 length:1017 start_codon:yes stop_codon:yes gene_type:complete